MFFRVKFIKYFIEYEELDNRAFSMYFFLFP